MASRGRTGTAVPCVSSRVRSKGTARSVPAGDVDQVAGGHVVGVAAAAQQHLLGPRAQIAHRHLRRIESTGLRGDREENGLAVRAAFPARSGRPRLARGQAASAPRVSPPAADTRCSPIAGLTVAKMIVSSGAHVAPRKCRRGGRSA